MGFERPLRKRTGGTFQSIMYQTALALSHKAAETPFCLFR